MFYKSGQEEKGKWKDDELQLSFFTKLANLFETKKQTFTYNQLHRLY